MAKLTERKGVVGKACGKCRRWYPLEKYHKKSSGLGGRANRCPNCEKERLQEYRKENKEKIDAYQAKYRAENAQNLIETQTQYRENNREKLNALKGIHRENNRDLYRLREQQRRARKRLLPDNLIELGPQYTTCFLTDSDGAHLDHAIPISIGHGGTTYGNMYALRSDLNESKKDRNLFEWFERQEIPQSSFDSLIDYLAQANKLTVDEYQEFYYWCFANPRSLDDIKADQRHSIEIWREATGRALPLPKWTTTYNKESKTRAG